MYCDRNFKTKKELKAAFKAGDKITVFQTGGIYPSQKHGTTSIEGPHSPEPHTWYAIIEIEKGVIIKILS